MSRRLHLDRVHVVGHGSPAYVVEGTLGQQDAIGSGPRSWTAVFTSVERIGLPAGEIVRFSVSPGTRVSPPGDRCWDRCQGTVVASDGFSHVIALATPPDPLIVHTDDLPSVASLNLRSERRSQHNPNIN